MLQLDFRTLINCSLRVKCHASFLEYIGVQDEINTIGFIFFHFNILDPTHPRYKSTVTVMRKVKDMAV